MPRWVNGDQVGPGASRVRWLRRAALLAAVAVSVAALGSGSALARGGATRSGAVVRISSELVPGLDAMIGRGLVRFAPDRARWRMLSLTVVLRRSDQAGFTRYLRAVQSRGSPLFRRYLSQARLADRFGPSRPRYGAVLSWLRAEGFSLVQGSANRLTLTVRGTRGQAERAFRTPIRDLVGGSRTAYANLRAPAIPGALGGAVLAVTGLSTLAVPTAAPSDVYTCQHGGARDVTQCGGNQCLNAQTGGVPGHITVQGWGLAGALGNAFAAVGNALLALPSTKLTAAGLYGPDVIAYCLGTSLGNSNPPGTCNLLVAIGQLPVGSCGPVPPTKKPPCRRCKPHTKHAADLAGAATVTAPSDGDPPTQKIGLLEYDTFRPSDVSDWLTLLGVDPSVGAKLSQVSVGGGVASPGAGESEVLVDLAAVMGGAPLSAASYVVYSAPPSVGFAQMFQAMIADGDTVISNSWSQCEDQTPLADAQAIDEILSQAAASGISVLNGTGDNGSTCLDGSPNTIGVPADSPNALAVGGTTPTFGPGLTYAHETYWDTRAGTPPGGAGGFGVSRYFPVPDYQQGVSGTTMRSVPDVSFAADPTAGVELCQADAGGCPDGRLYGGTSMATPAVAAEIANLNQRLGQNVGDLNANLYQFAGTSAFHSAASMGSDFAHVGLGSPRFDSIYQQLTQTTTGAVSTTESRAFGLYRPQADGSDTGLVRVDLVDGSGFPVGGKTVTLAPTAGGATVSPAQAVTDPVTGSALFTVTDAASETVSFTAADTTDGVTLATHPTLTFVAPSALGASIVASPQTVLSNGSATATITVYLQDRLGRPAAGKTVSLSRGGSQAVLSSPTAVTDSTGTASFTATDAAQESVAFTATDVSDGNLPVPGSAIVTFQPTGTPSCTDTVPTPQPGFTVSSLVSGLPNNSQALITNNGGLSFTVPACGERALVAFDPSGTAYVPDGLDGRIYTFGPAGGIAGPGNSLPGTTFLAGGQLGGLAFGPGGELYASLNNTGGNFNDPEIVQLDPSTGAVERVLATAAGGLGPCPQWIAVDPLSGDIFSTDNCGGSLASGNIWRVSNPGGAHPTTSVYTTVGGSAGIAFAPDGTLYVADLANQSIMSVTGTNTPTPVVNTVYHQTNAFFGVTVAAADSQGHATTLDAVDDVGTITQIKLGATVTATQIATTAGGPVLLAGDAVGPDGCLYAADEDRLLRVTGINARCTAAGGTPAPAIELTSGGPAPAPTGAPVTFTARLVGFSAADGTPVRFDITGANPAAAVVHADAGGTATFTFSGPLTGGGTVQAFATDASTTVSSAPLGLRWTAGKDVTFLSLNASPESGPVGQPATLSANLLDLSQAPATPVAGAPVTLSLTGQSCDATTDGAGNASCAVTPAGSAGLSATTAAYAGDSTHTPASASNVFALGASTPPPGGPPGTQPPVPPPSPPGGPTVPGNTGAPAISGSPAPGDTLTCAHGTWSNAPTGYTYVWNRDSKPIGGAAGPSYVVQVADETRSLTCTVTAANAAGQSAPATSAAVRVVVPGTLGCPKPSGSISGRSLGPLKLGITRVGARRTLRRFGVTYNNFDDFCLYGGWGVRAGYPSPSLLRTVPAGLRPKLKGRVILLLTANPAYAIRGVRPGAALGAVARALHLGKVFHVGRNDWYIVHGGGVSQVFKARQGIIYELGLADRRLTATRAAQQLFLRSFPSTPASG
jgi:hypothetical protein